MKIIQKLNIIIILYPFVRFLILVFLLIAIRSFFFCHIVHAEMYTTNADLIENNASNSNVKSLVKGIGVTLTVIAGLYLWYLFDTAMPIEQSFDTFTENLLQIAPLREYTIDLFNHCLTKIKLDEIIVESGLFSFCMTEVFSYMHEKFTYLQLIKETPEVHLLKNIDKNSALSKILYTFADMHKSGFDEKQKWLIQQLSISHVVMTHYEEGTPLNLLIVHAQKSDLYANARVEFIKLLRNR